MNLCVDIGNTTAKAALFVRGKKDPVRIYRTARPGAAWIRKILSDSDVTAAIVSSTAVHDERIDEQLSSVEVFIQLDHNTPVPIRNKYRTPETLGRDRLAAICGAQDIYPGDNVLVIDAGTCITLDMITGDGVYTGGSIHPGIEMRFKALNNYTGKLPLVKKRKGVGLIGHSTEESILTGVIYAAAREMDGMIADYTVKFGELKVIITGGDASLFVSQMKSKIFAHANLVLSGLNKILDHNEEMLK